MITDVAATIFQALDPATPLLRLVAMFFVLAVLFAVVIYICGLIVKHLEGRNLLFPRPTTPTPKPPAAQALQIGSYTVASVLGKGGMGTVFKAFSPHGQPVAIKMIGGLLAKPNAKAKEANRIALVREARLAAELRHPNIVKIYDIGLEKGHLYVVMEYLQGAPLDRHIRNHAINVSEALRIGAELCDALSYANSRGIIHRDVKPQNVFIMKNGSVKLLDFGLARPSKVRCSPGGTLPYMSPEQILGKTLDGRTDIWSAGVTVFEMLSGTRPFSGRRPGVFANILRADVPALELATPHCLEIQTILAHALAKDRNQRYSSASHFAEALRLVLRKMAQGQDVGQIPATPASDSSPPRLHAEAIAAQGQQYIPVNLGFAETVAAKVVFPVVRAKRGALYSIGRAVPALAKSLALNLAWTIFLGGIGFILFGFLIVISMLFAIFVVVPIAIVEAVFPPPFYRCRSCSRRMRSASAWTRPVWISDKIGFCLPDCLAALKMGLWEEAVKLLHLHTPTEDHQKRFKLEFFECKTCRDQRAYLMVETKHDEVWIIDSVREAYKFCDAVNGQVLVRSSSGTGQPPPEKAKRA